LSTTYWTASPLYNPDSFASSKELYPSAIVDCRS
jgi:hypothetical protein